MRRDDRRPGTGRAPRSEPGRGRSARWTGAVRRSVPASISVTDIDVGSTCRLRAGDVMSLPARRQFPRSVARLFLFSGHGADPDLFGPRTIIIEFRWAGGGDPALLRRCL